MPAKSAPDRAPDIAVVGTGVVGLTAALGCAQQGLDVVLVGPAPRIADDASGARFDARIYAVSPASTRLLEAQRVWREVGEAASCAVARMRVFGDDGGELRFDARAAGVERLATICEERRLLRALWLAVGMTPRIAHRPQGFAAAEFAAGTVRVHLEDGDAFECALLLGADGKSSAVRAAVGIGARVADYGQTAIVANFACARPHHGVAHQWFTGAEGVLALLPLPGQHVSLVWSAPHALAGALQALPAPEFAQRVAQRSGGMLGALEPVGERRAFALDQVVVERLVRPGLALVGDAAHVVHPLAGQGLNLGLQDVSELLRQLGAREPWRAPGDIVWLRRYERARAEPIALMRGVVGGLARLFDARDARVRRLRNLGLTAVDAFAPLKHTLVRHAMG